MGSRITEKHAKSVKTKLLSHFKEKRLSLPASTKGTSSGSNVEQPRPIVNEKTKIKEQAHKENEKENRSIQIHGNETSQKSHHAKQFHHIPNPAA